jgi:hypothetical protein
LRVGGEERDPLDECLGEQNPIERILVKRRQCVDIHGMLAGDREFHVPVVEQTSAEDARLDAKVVAPVMEISQRLAALKSSSFSGSFS